MLKYLKDGGEGSKLKAESSSLEAECIGLEDGSSKVEGKSSKVKAECLGLEGGSSKLEEMYYCKRQVVR